MRTRHRTTLRTMLLGTMLAVGCSGEASAPQPAADVTGLVLYAKGGVIVVEHADPLGRIAPGVARYSAEESLALAPGQAVDLWLTGETRPRAISRAEVRGAGTLPPNHAAGGHPVSGLVVRVDGGKLTVEHDAIPGLMGAMVMPFDVGPDVAPAFAPGDTIRGKLVVSRYGYRLVEVEKTGEQTVELREDTAPIVLGERIPSFAVPTSHGETWQLGAKQSIPTAVSFIYTRCPDPNFCPAVVSRMAALQERIRGRARILLVTIDPDYDHLPTLGMYGGLTGAEPDTWGFGRLDPIELNRLALASGLSVTVRSGKISHRLRLLILDGDGRLIERYDDNAWPLDRVASQLLTGAPADATATGTLFEEQDP